jgi:uncharacterized protein (TIGR01777 family)
MSPSAFERLAPAWQNLVPVKIPETPVDGATAEFFLKAGLLKLRWLARLGPVEAPYRFVDTQELGPFSFWRHEHLIEPTGPDRATLTDNVTYSLPAGLGSIPLMRRVAHAELERLFSFRHQRMVEDLKRFPQELPGRGRIVLVSGSTGLIGRRLVPYLQTLGYTVRELSRSAEGKGTFRWDPGAGWVDPEALEGVDAVIHLAGENIAGGRWSESRKERILRSRVDGTRTLVNALGELGRPPGVFICASGINVYGGGFLAEVCDQWEAEAARAKKAGARVVYMRTGIVLDPLGGALGKMLPAFRFGLGGPIGSGSQNFPWIAMDDLLDLYAEAIEDAQYDGPVDAIHHEVVNQRAFSNTLGAVLHRPAVLPLPTAVIKAILGQMGEETLLADLAVRPGNLRREEFEFRFAGLREALSFMLGKSA